MTYLIASRSLLCGRVSQIAMLRAEHGITRRKTAAAPAGRGAQPAPPASFRVAVPGRRGYVERGVAVEEAARLQHEAGPGDRHHRPVLQPDDVRRPERVPHDDVLAVDVPVACDVAGQPAAGVLVHEIAGRIPLRGVIA